MIEFDLKPMFSPQSIAIIGASSDESKIGGRPLYMLKQIGFKGEIFPVNPKYEEIAGYRCLPDIQSLPEHVDLAIIAVKSNAVLSSLELLAARSIKSAVIFSSGFAEVGAEGIEMQNKLTEFIKKSGIPVAGPNCNGFTNLKENVIASFSPVNLDQVDPIAFISQSGAVATVTTKLIRDIGCGYQYLVGTGNEAGVDFFDYVNYFAQQQEVKVIGGYLEGARNKQSMERALASCLENEKPLVLLKVGNSEKGADAATSHTGSLAGNSAIYSSYLKKKNVIQVNSEEELVDTLALFNNAKLPSSLGDVALVTGSGGAGIIMADKCEEYGVPLAKLQPETTAKLKDILPSFAALGNPIDVTAQVLQTLDNLFESIEVILNDDNVGTVVYYMQLWDHLAPTFIPRLEQIAANTDKTFIVCWSGVADETKQKFRESDFCWMPTPSRTIRALKNMNEYNRNRLTGSYKKFSSEERMTVPQALEAVFGNANEHTGKTYLAKYGISVPTGKVVTSKQDAVNTAEEIGYPVVMKIASEQIAHKSDAGGVKINVKSDLEVKRAYDEIWTNAKNYNPDAQLEGILVEKMIEDGIEVIIGSVQDPLFGPCILFGIGGIFVEVFNDVVLRPAPLTREDAYEMVQSIKGYTILKGARGKGPYDIDTLEETLVRISEFSFDQSEWLKELDINPVIVHEKGKGVTAVDALIVGNEKKVSHSTPAIEAVR